MLGTVGGGPGVPLPSGVWIDVPSYNPSCTQCVADGLAGNLTKWTGEFVGRGAELIRWSANSDKWVMQKIGNGWDGHASDNDNGSNQLLCNFMDSVALNISKNPPPPVPKPNTYPSGYVFQNNDAGDVWVSDPVNNPSGDRYEDVLGRWHTAVDGAIVGSHIALAPAKIFVVVEKDSALPGKTIQISNNGIGTLNTIATTVKYSTGATDWLSVTISGSGNNQQIGLQFKNTSFAANTYHAALSVYALGTSDTAYLPVDLCIQVARSPDNPSNALPGLAYKYYEGTWFPTPGYDSMTPVKTGISANLDLSPVPANHPENYGLSFKGYLDVPAQGMYTFTLVADDMARLYIGGVLVVSSTWMATQSGQFTQKAGKHIVCVEQSQTIMGDGLSLSWECQKAGIAKQVIPSNKWYYTSGSVPISLRMTQLRKPAATLILYTVHGKRVGTLTNSRAGNPGRELYLAVPEKPGDRTSKTKVIVW